MQFLISEISQKKKNILHFRTLSLTNFLKNYYQQTNEEDDIMIDNNAINKGEKWNRLPKQHNIKE